jgi:subtilisin family serine protease
MRVLRILTGTIAIAITACSSSSPTAESTDDEPPTSVAATAATAPRVLTLITGDRVIVKGPGQATIQPGAGRDKISFLREQVGGHLRVIPSDALPMLRAGTIDPRLFDVTLQLEFGYDRRTETPLLLTGATPGVTLRSASPPGLRTTRAFSTVGAVAARAAHDGALWKSLAAGHALGYGKVWLDGLRKPTLDVSVPLIGAPTAWQQGFDGTGVVVAVLDTGIDVSHPDLADRVLEQVNFTADDAEQGGEDDTLDHVGHGTHVASTIAGSGAASGGRYRGVAPGARLLDGKVCTDYGCAESWLLAGMEWAAQRAQVINMSLSGPDAPELDPLEQAVDTLTAQYGALFVIAAGNNYTDRSVGSPGSADAALTVGAVDKAEQLADFSSRGPRTGDHALKPEITGPGVEIVAARSKDGGFGSPGELYTSLDGTSMATPHVAGAAAILKQRRPAWRAAELKAALMATAQPSPTLTGFEQGAGRVDVARAIAQEVTSEPLALSFGVQRFPHDDDAPVARPITYRNASAVPVTLALAVHAVGPDHTALPAGTFTLDAELLTVPAGGTATATVTCDTRSGEVLGLLGGQVTATATDGAVRVVTPFGVEREVESYDVTLVSTTRDGAPAETFETFLLDTSVFQLFGGMYFATSSRSTFRVPRGTYAVMAAITDDSAGPDTQTLLYHPTFELTSDRVFEADARLGKPISIRLPERGYELVQGNAIVMDFPTPDGGTGLGVVTTDFDRTFTAQFGEGSLANTEGHVGGTWARRGRDGTFDNSPATYTLIWFHTEEFPSGFHRRVWPWQLARVEANYAAQAPGNRVEVEVQATSPNGKFDGGNWWTNGALVGGTAPLRRTEYFLLDNDPKFHDTMYEYSATGAWLGYHDDEWRSYPRGRSTKRTNRGVFSPDFGRTFPFGDEIGVYVPLFGGLSEGTYRTRLRKDGVVIGEVVGTPDDVAISATVATAGPGSYRLELEGVRDVPGIVSSRVEVTYDFTLDSLLHPATFVKFHPRLDEHNAARAGERLRVPFTIARDEIVTERPRIDVSYDDGATWHRTRVHGDEPEWYVELDHPHRARHVSLRARTVDTSGNVLVTTVIRAYHLER